MNDDRVTEKDGWDRRGFFVVRFVAQLSRKHESIQSKKRGGGQRKGNVIVVSWAGRRKLAFC